MSWDQESKVDMLAQMPSGPSRMLKLKERVEMRRKSLHDQLDEVNKLLNFIEQHPEYEEFTNLLSNANV